VDRRTFLTLTGSFAGTLLLPSMKGSPAALDGLHRRAQNLAAGARSQRPSATLAEAGDLLQVTEAAFLVTVPQAQRRQLHRTAALTALVGAQAAQRAAHPVGSLLDRALGHAAGARDGPLEAQVLMVRRDEEGATGRLVGAGSEASVNLLHTAIDAAGASRAASSVRAVARYRLAWELGALGQRRAALAELAAADAEAEMASPAPDCIEDADLRCGGASAWRGIALRVAHRPQEAEAALSEAIASRPNPATSLVVLAKVKADTDDVDAAVAALEDAFLLARATGNARAAVEARAAATDLPDCTAVRSLKELLRA
jgi:tetratricopeptide (TPR) repeat protein